MKLTHIAQELRINRLDVKKVLIAEGLYREKNKFIEDDKVAMFKIEQFYKSGRSIKEISKEVGYGDQAISKALKSIGIELRKAGDYNKKYYINEKAFDLYTPESVYWAGFIAGDGCVYSHGLSNGKPNYLTVSLSIKDEKHLAKLKKFLCYDGVLYYDKRKTKVTLTVNSIKIVNTLKKMYGITRNKSEIYKPPKTIPSNMKKYFVLGLLDADGGISKVKRPKAARKHYKGEYVFQVGFTGTKESCEYVKNHFNSNVKLFSRNIGSINNYSIVFQGNLQVIEYMASLYDSYSIIFCLERKLYLFKELLEQYSDSRLELINLGKVSEPKRGVCDSMLTGEA